MRDFYRQQLEELNEELIRMGASCEKIIGLSADALTTYSEELARNVRCKPSGRRRVGTLPEKECGLRRNLASVLTKKERRT